MSSSEMNPINRSPNLASSSAFQQSPDQESCSHDTGSDNSAPQPQPGSASQQPPQVVVIGYDYSPELRDLRSAFQELLHIVKETRQTHEQTKEAEKSNTFAKKIAAISKKKDMDVPISIFKVPETLTSAKPEAYVPQLIGLGAIHHLRPELQHMQMYKVKEAIRIHYGFPSGLEFEKLVEFLKQITATSVRSSYNIYLDMEDDVLACIMAVDGLFLFNLLCCYGISKETLASSTSLSHLVESTEKRLARDTTIEVAMMLENQIPIFVLKVILIIECWREYSRKRDLAHGRISPGTISKTVSDLLPRILLGFCKYCFSPLRTAENYPPLKALKHVHLLDLLYHLVTLKPPPKRTREEEKEELRLLEEEKKEELRLLEVLSEKVCPQIAYLIVPESQMRCKTVEEDLIESAKPLAPKQLQKPIELVQGLLGLPWSQTKSSIVSALKKEVPEKEVFIPRAWKLHKAGVKFEVAAHITDINFKRKEVSLCLPVITINASFEVVIRNLVAYEAMIKSEKEVPILNWYVELMNGLIQTAEDVTVLKAQGIISKESIDDEQIAKFFSGMNKSVELKNIASNLNAAVGDVKKYYDDVWWVATFKFMKRGWRTTKKWFAVFAALLALFLLAVQTFCSVYQCSRFSFKISNSSHALQASSPLPSLRSRLV